MTTRAAIIRRAVLWSSTAGKSLGYATRDGEAALEATGGTATTLVDTAGLPPAGAAAETAKKWWLYRPEAAAADQKRIVASYSGADRAFTHEGPDYASAPTAGERYLVLENDPDVWNAAVNEALRTQLSRVQRTVFTPTVAEQVLWPLEDAPISVSNVERESQVFALEWADASETVGAEKWRDWSDGVRRWSAITDDGVVTLDFEDPRHAPTTDQRLRLTTVVQYPAAIDDDTDIEVDEFWAAMATLSILGAWLADPDNQADQWNIVSRIARAQYDDRRRAILGRFAYRTVGRHSERAGIGGVRGRAGGRR